MHERAHRVLVVDDNRDAADMLSDWLADSGYHAACAFDGAEAIAAALDFQPHLALVDIGLPTMDGFELAERLRRLPGLGQLRLVAVSGYGNEHDLDDPRRTAFDEYLVKPVDMHRLAEVLRALLGETQSGA